MVESSWVVPAFGAPVRCGVAPRYFAVFRLARPLRGLPRTGTRIPPTAGAAFLFAPVPVGWHRGPPLAGFVVPR